VWGYTNGLGERIERNNPKDFLSAADHMTKAMQCYRAGGLDYPATGLSHADRDVVWSLINGARSEEATKRHDAWVEKIAAGAVSFGPEKIAYAGEGAGSWQHRALGAIDRPNDGFAYGAEF